MYYSDLYEAFVRPYFFDSGQRVVYKDDLVAVQAALRTVEFKVTSVVPEPCCYVSATTVVLCDQQSVRRAVSTQRQ